MSGNLETVFSQVVMACSFAALAAIAMREATTDRTLHLCARVLGLSAWTALLALSYFTVREYEKLERVLIVRQSTKVVEPTLVSKTEMELPSGITISWTYANAPAGACPSRWDFAMPDISGPHGGSGAAGGQSAADFDAGRPTVSGVPGEQVDIGPSAGAAQTL